MPSAIRGPRLVVLGRQGAGKGTQAAKMVAHLGVHHLSTGTVLRQEVAADTPLGREVAEVMADGRLVPDELVLQVVDHCLRDDDVKRRGFLLDGFPRTQRQAAALLQLLGSSGLDAAINLEVPAAVVRRRLLSRRVCSRCDTPTTAARLLPRQAAPGRRRQPRLARRGLRPPDARAPAHPLGHGRSRQLSPLNVRLPACGIDCCEIRNDL